MLRLAAVAARRVLAHRRPEIPAAALTVSSVAFRVVAALRLVGASDGRDDLLLRRRRGSRQLEHYRRLLRRIGIGICGGGGSSGSGSGSGSGGSGSGCGDRRTRHRADFLACDRRGGVVDGSVRLPGLERREGLASRAGEAAHRVAAAKAVVEREHGGCDEEVERVEHLQRKEQKQRKE